MAIAFKVAKGDRPRNLLTVILAILVAQKAISY
jgi:hypothetical protein